MKQTILTFVAKVDPARIPDLKALLADMAKDVEGNALIPFPQTETPALRQPGDQRGSRIPVPRV